jgi:hypothetical protein
MSQAERYAWLSLGVWGVVLFVLLARFTAGGEFLGQSIGLRIVEQPAAALLVTYVWLGIVAGIGEAVVASVLAPSTGGAIARDERDKAIEARSQRVAYWTVGAAINVVIIHVLANAAFGGHVLPKIDLASLTGMSFALLLILVTAEIVERASRIWQYRMA